MLSDQNRLCERNYTDLVRQSRTRRNWGRALDCGKQEIWSQQKLILVKQWGPVSEKKIYIYKISRSEKDLLLCRDMNFYISLWFWKRRVCRLNRRNLNLSSSSKEEHRACWWTRAASVLNFLSPNFIGLYQHSHWCVHNLLWKVWISF